LTQLQSDLFVKIAKMGWLSGLENPIEWYVNYCRSLDMWCRYEDVEQKEREATECMVSFFFENGMFEYTEEEKNKEFDELIKNFYSKERLQDIVSKCSRKLKSMGID